MICTKHLLTLFIVFECHWKLCIYELLKTENLSDIMSDDLTVFVGHRRNLVGQCPMPNPHFKACDIKVINLYIKYFFFEINSQ